MEEDTEEITIVDEMNEQKQEEEKKPKDTKEYLQKLFRQYEINQQKNYDL